MPRLHAVRLPLFAALFLISLACGDDPARPPTPTAMEVLSGDEQDVVRGEDPPNPLRVRVTGSDGRPSAGVTVRWAVIGGQVTLDRQQSTTDADGVAEVRVKEVGTIGPVLVSATVTGIEPVIFTVRGLDPCDLSSAPTITPGTTVSGVLKDFDCLIHGDAPHDVFNLTLSTQQSLLLRLRSTVFDPVVELYSLNPWYLFEQDTVDARRDVRRHAILPPGPYALAVTAFGSPNRGAYEFSIPLTPESAASCDSVFTMVGIMTQQSLAATDCAGTDRRQDVFGLVLADGQGVRLTQTSTQFAPLLRLVRSGQVVLEADGSATGTATIEYAAHGLGIAFYFVIATSAQPQQSGSYTLGMAPLPGTWQPFARAGGSPTLLSIRPPGEARSVGGEGPGPRRAKAAHSP